ncbi:glycosyltransferase [Novosphingobium panipatense]|uniref:glycosyltransferase n=1 Tax=Novosphingobium panipatense TaxID=428991 RepID=UPI0036221AF5
MPLALEQMDLRGYDLVISSESGPAKGVITDPDATHLCYVHSPMRYLWDHYHQYRDTAGALNRAVMPYLFHKLRTWDVASASRVDRYIANSHFIQRRIARAWRVPSTVVHPPVDVSLFDRSETVEDSYLWVGQLVPYKRPDLAVEAFNRLGLPLTVVGDGPMAAGLRRAARPNVTIVPRLDFTSLRRVYARCRGFLFTAEEDFGIAPVEVMASGRPVIAYRKGGALDTVIDGQTGIFFDDQTVASLMDAVSRFEDWLSGFEPELAMLQASRFAPRCSTRAYCDRCSDRKAGFMELTAVGALQLLLALALFGFGSLTPLFALVVASTLLGGSAAVFLPALGGSSVSPAHFALGLLLLRCVLPGASHRAP